MKVNPDRNMTEVVVKKGVLEGTDLYFENVMHVFTEDEKEEIKKELEPVIEASIKKALQEYNTTEAADLLKDKKKMLKLAEPSMENFLMKIEYACNFMVWMKYAPSRQEYREKLIDILKSLKETNRYLKQIYNRQVYIPLRREIPEPSFPMFGFLLDQFIAKGSVIRARKAEQHLESLIKIIEEYQQPKEGKGSPGSYTTQLATSVAHSYYSSFWVKPTTYFDGPFVKVFEKLLDILGLDYRDNTRAIRAAVKSVEKKYNLQ